MQSLLCDFIVTSLWVVGSRRLVDWGSMVSWFVVSILFFDVGFVMVVLLIGIFIVLLTLRIVRPNFWFVMNWSLVITTLWLPVVVWLGPFTRLGVVMRPVPVRILMIVLIGVSVEDVCSVVELSVTAGQDVGTGANHVIRKGKLLTVEDEEVFVLIEPALGPFASSLEVVCRVPLFVNFVVDGINPLRVPVDMVVIVFDAVIVVLDAVIDIVDVVCEVQEGLPHCFE